MSDFGRGYAVCLLQFVFHEPRLAENIALYAMMRAKESSLFTESSAVEIWANGASDHLYDLVTGARVPKAQRIAAQGVAASALACGHGFTGATWTEAQARKWLTMARELLRLAGEPATIEEAEAIDRGLGLRPERGESATCVAPIPLRGG